MSLVIYGKKCDIPFNQVRKDAYSLLLAFERITTSEDNHFTKGDIEDALKMYKEEVVTFPRNSVEYLTGIRIDPNRRNGRRRNLHLKLARMQKSILKEAGEVKEGRPKGSVISAETSPKAKKIREWRCSNPDGNKSDCARGLGISRPTVQKWWDSHF